MDDDGRPPRDLYGDLAVTRSVGALLYLDDRRWRWDGRDWQEITTPPRIEGLSANAVIVDELARFLARTMEEE